MNDFYKFYLICKLKEKIKRFCLFIGYIYKAFVLMFFYIFGI